MKKYLLFLMTASVLSSCSTPPNLKNKDSVTSYLQSHKFSNSKGESITFAKDGSCATPTGSKSYQIKIDDDRAEIIMNGDNGDANHDWWYIDEHGLCHQISDNLDYYFKN